MPIRSSTAMRQTQPATAFPSLALVVLSLLPLSPAMAAPGDLDTSLAGTGFLLDDYNPNQNSNRQNSPFRPLLASDGSFKIFGRTSTFTEASTVIASFAADGARTGVALLTSEPSPSAAVQTTGGKLIVGRNSVSVAGTSVPGYLRRLNADGTLDTTFATNGIFTDGDQRLLGSEMTLGIDAQGRILVTSFASGLMRFTANGAPDASFGSDGIAELPADHGEFISFWSQSVAADGGIYVLTGPAGGAANRVLRYTSSGSLDAAFGVGGVLSLRSGSQQHTVLAMPDSGVLVLEGCDNQNPVCELVHYDATGMAVNTAVINEVPEGFASQAQIRRGAVLRHAPGNRILLSAFWVGARSTPPFLPSGQLFGLFESDLTPVTAFDGGGNGLIVHYSAPVGEVPGIGFEFNTPMPSRAELGVDAQGRILYVGEGFNSSFQPQWAAVRLQGNGGSGGTPTPTPIPTPMPDTTPDAFLFTPQSDVATATVVQSNAVTITGIDAATAVSVDGGEYSIGCSTSFTAAAGSINNGQTVCVRHTSAATFNTETTTTLTVGGISADFVSTTGDDPGVGPDTTPDAFSFTAQNDVAFGATVTSNTVTISGIDRAATLSVTGGSYSIGCGSSFTTAPATINNGQQVCVRHVAATSCASSTTTTLNVGGVMDSFVSTTVDETADSDGDGVSDCSDDTPFDASVANPTLPGGNTLSMATAAGSFADIEILEADALDNQSGRPADLDFATGLVSYSITGLENGETVTVTLTYPAPLPAGSAVFKYSDANGFQPFDGAAIDGNTVTLTLVDGGAGDADGLANGTIVDPVGVAITQPRRGGGSLTLWMLGLLSLGLVAVGRRQRTR